MAMPVPHYVNPSLDSNTGDGSPGDPYGDLEYAVSQVGVASTGGDIFLLEPGTTEVLSANIVPFIFTTVKPFIIAGNGGEATINCNGNKLLTDLTTSYYGFGLRDLHVRSTGTNPLMKLPRLSTWIRVKVSDVDNDVISGHVYSSDRKTLIGGCTFTDISGKCLTSDLEMQIVGCHFYRSGTKTPTHCIYSTEAVRVSSSTFDVDGATHAIYGTSTSNTAMRVDTCSILSAGGTGTGITCGRRVMGIFADTIIEGFRGTGGKALDLQFTSEPAAVVCGMSFYDNATDIVDHTGAVVEDYENLSASAFAKSGSPSDRNSYFAPSGEASAPYLCGTARGAIQSVGGGSGSTIIIPRRSVRI